MNNQKEILIELLKEAIEVDAWDNGEYIERKVNYEEAAHELLRRVVVLPKPLGTPVWVIERDVVFDDSLPGNKRVEYRVETRKLSCSLMDYSFYLTEEEAQKECEQMNRNMRRLLF